MSDQPFADEFEVIRSQMLSADDSIRKRAIEELIRRYTPAIQRYAVSSVLNRMDPSKSAQDVTSEVCLKLWRRLVENRVELINEYFFLGYVRLMTERVAIDMTRRKSLRPGSLDPTPGEDAIDPPDSIGTPSMQVREAERQVALDHLREQIRRLVQPHEWHLFEQRFFRGLTWEEIAAENWDGDAAPSKEQLKALADKLRIRLDRLQERLGKQLQISGLFEG